MAVKFTIFLHINTCINIYVNIYNKFKKMAGVSVSFYLSNSCLLIGLCELYYTWYISSNYLLSSKSFLLNKNNQTTLATNINRAIYYLLVHMWALMTWYMQGSSWILQTKFIYGSNFFILTLIGVVIFFCKKWLSTNTAYILLLWLGTFISLFYVINNLLTLILMLELIATIYYFFFLNNLGNTTQQLLKLKNLIMNYLWLSLFTLICFVVAIIFFIIEVGTLAFVELNILHTSLSSLSIIVFICAFLWKLGLPGFHFFKFELYQYLPIAIVFYFSIFSVIISVFLLSFLFFSLTLLITHTSLILLIIIVGANSLLLLSGLTNIKLFQFIALSGLNTLTTVIIFFLA